MYKPLMIMASAKRFAALLRCQTIQPLLFVMLSLYKSMPCVNCSVSLVIGISQVSPRQCRFYSYNTMSMYEPRIVFLLVYHKTMDVAFEQPSNVIVLHKLYILYIIYSAYILGG